MGSKEPTDEEKAQIISSLRSSLDISAEKMSDAHLRRFAIAREWNEKAASEMLTEHLKWREETLPMAHSAEIQRVIDSGRIRVLRRGKQPIICADFMWGGLLLEEDITKKHILDANIYVLEDVLAEADALMDDGQPAKYLSVCTGGPPPMDFIRYISPTFDINYPERLQTAIVYPVPTLFRYMVKAIMVLLPKRTSDKFCIFSEERDLLEKLGITSDELPEELKGGYQGSKERQNKLLQDKARMEQMPEGFVDAVAQGDQEVLEAKS